MAEAFKFLYNLDGTNEPPAVVKVPVAATQTLVVGDAVVLSSGKAAKGGGAFGRCLGIMAEDSTSQASGTLVKIYVTRPTQVWRAVAASSATSGVLGSRTYDLNSSLQVDPADTTGGSIQILKTDASATDVHIMFTANELG